MMMVICQAFNWTTFFRHDERERGEESGYAVTAKGIAEMQATEGTGL